MTHKTSLPTVQPQPYSDPTDLNTCRLVMDSVGKEVLADILGDFLELLNSSAAVYEANGDYAQGIFTSGWCRRMDVASRNLCGTADNRAALGSGKWLCHESCWHTSKSSMEMNVSADEPCHGGIRIHAVPIQVHGQVVGSINFGYGDPPTDPRKLTDLAEKYGLPVEELRSEAAAYKSRDPFVIEVAKSRVAAAAKLIGVIIERRQAEQQLEHSQVETERRVTKHRQVERRLVAEHAITTILAEFTSLEEAVPKIIRVICESLGWAVGTMWKVDPDRQRLSCLAIYQADADKAEEFEALTRQITIAYGVCLPGRIWASGKPCWITDVTKDAEFSRAADAVNHGLHGALAFPILAGEKVLGVIEFFSHEIQVPDEEILPMMASVGSQIGQAIERKRIDEDLRASEERYRQIVETAIEGIWTIDADAKTTFVNERMAQMLGYTAEEMIGRPLFGLLHERDRGQALERFERIRQGATSHFDMVLHRKDGTELPTMVSAAPFLDKEGLFAGALAMITDISERRKLEEQFRQAQKMEAFGQLAGGGVRAK